MTNVNFESVGIPDVGFSLTKVGDQLFFPCGPVFEFVGLSTNSTVVKQGYSSLKKSFAGVSISEPFCKTIRSGKTFLTAEAFLALVFGSASSFTRSQTFDVDRLLSLRKFFTARIFEGERHVFLFTVVVMCSNLPRCWAPFYGIVKRGRRYVRCEVNSRSHHTVERT